jgi:hypothetical protein
MNRTPRDGLPSLDDLNFSDEPFDPLASGSGISQMFRRTGSGSSSGSGSTRPRSRRNSTSSLTGPFSSLGVSRSALFQHSKRLADSFAMVLARS